MKRTILTILFALVLTASLAAQSTQPGHEGFSWHAEMVALDQNAKMITVKARVVGDQAPAEFAKRKPGERVMLVWSGLDKYADAIRELRLSNASKAEDHFAFPVEFVSFDTPQNYVTFKVQVPESAVSRLKSIKPGEWVTATSPHGPSSQTQPIVMIRHYNDPVGTNSN